MKKPTALPLLCYLGLLCCLLPNVYAQDSLLYFSGKNITTAADWENHRRPQVKQQVLSTIYGHMPAPPRWSAQTVKCVELKEQQALYKEVLIQLYKGEITTRTIRLSVFIPTHIARPAPVILAINKCGNLTVTNLPLTDLCSHCILHPKCKKQMQHKGGLRGLQTNYWSVDTLLQRGYAFATFHDSDIAADTNSLAQGIFPYYPELNNDTGWQMIAAWAWGLQRAVDYLVTDSLIDAQRVILFGHSRRGKAALLAAALDERVAMVVPHQSGTGGMALSKARPMESLRSINRHFPFWFNGRFKQYAGKARQLPLDQHYLLALMAPRPVVETVGTLDVWSSYPLSVKTMRLAAPVYQLYHVPAINGKVKFNHRHQLKQAAANRLLQIRRPYTHTMNADYWHCILDVADVMLYGK